MTRNVIKTSQGYLMLIYGHALFFYSLVLTVEIKYYDLFIYFNFRLPIVNNAAVYIDVEVSV